MLILCDCGPVASPDGIFQLSFPFPPPIHTRHHFCTPGARDAKLQMVSKSLSCFGMERGTACTEAQRRSGLEIQRLAMSLGR